MEEKLINEEQDQSAELEAPEVLETAEGADAEDLPSESEDEGELERMRAELEELRGELARRDALEEGNRRMMRECEEFGEYFPEVELSAVPDEVWESVKGGLPLAASYALYARREELQKLRADELNQRNRMMSAGSVSKGGEEKYYSPSEVKAMTREQVRSNYSEIVESMRHWH